MQRMPTLVLPALFALLAAAPALAGSEPGELRGERDGRENPEELCGDAYGRVWIRGHHEDRIEYVKCPAVTERRRIPARCEQVWIPPVCERIWIDPVRTQVWVPPVVERVLVPARWETVHDGLGRPHRFCSRPARYETRVVREGCWEDRIVVPGRWEERVVAPGRYETRIVEPERWETVVVSPERVEKRVTRVWVPGRWVAR